MSYRDLDNIDEKLIAAVLYIGAKDGLHAVTARKVADRCKVSDYTVFSHMGGTKISILDAAARHFDEEYLAYLRKLCRKGLCPEQLWDEMMDYLVNHPDGASYYADYLAIRSKSIGKDAMRAGLLVSMADSILGPKEFSEEEILMLWDYEITLLFYYAKKFISKDYPYDELTRRFVKDLVFSSLLKDAGKPEE